MLSLGLDSKEVGFPSNARLGLGHISGFEQGLGPASKQILCLVHPARYTGQLLSPAEGLGLWLRAFVVLQAKKKGLSMQF